MKEETQNKIITTTVITVPSVIILTFLFWILCLNNVDYQHVGVALNNNSGEITLQEKPGWYITSPFVRVKEVSLRPTIVSCNQYNRAKTINQKLVRIRPDKVRAFVNYHGFSDLPTDWSVPNEACLTGYAYSDKEYEWLEIIEDSEKNSVK